MNQRRALAQTCRRPRRVCVPGVSSGPHTPLSVSSSVPPSVTDLQLSLPLEMSTCKKRWFWAREDLLAWCSPWSPALTVRLSHCGSGPGPSPSPALCLRCHVTWSPTDFMACEGNVETTTLPGVVAIWKGAQRCSLHPRPPTLCCPPSFSLVSGLSLPKFFRSVRQTCALFGHLCLTRSVLRSGYPFAASVVTPTVYPGTRSHQGMATSSFSVQLRTSHCVDPLCPFSHSLPRGHVGCSQRFAGMNSAAASDPGTCVSHFLADPLATAGPTCTPARRVRGRLLTAGPHAVAGFLNFFKFHG